MDPIGVDQRFFSEPDLERWRWATPATTRLYSLDVAASLARLDNHSVDETSILYQLVRFSQSTPYVSVLAKSVGTALKVSPKLVLEFLCRHGYIFLKI